MLGKKCIIVLARKKHIGNDQLLVIEMAQFLFNFSSFLFVLLILCSFISSFVAFAPHCEVVSLVDRHSDLRMGTSSYQQVSESGTSTLKFRLRSS